MKRWDRRSSRVKSRLSRRRLTSLNDALHGMPAATNETFSTSGVFNDASLILPRLSCFVFSSSFFLLRTLYEVRRWHKVNRLCFNRHLMKSSTAPGVSFYQLPLPLKLLMPSVLSRVKVRDREERERGREEKREKACGETSEHKERESKTETARLAQPVKEWEEEEEERGRERERQ